jgi:ABC-type dipeptide/oligopeptide/nickel transport system ATPase component
MSNSNPFEYVGANDLSRETILDYYIDDFNFSRFVNSSRNVFLVGERGCGKSMTLLYSSFPVQLLRSE